MLDFILLVLVCLVGAAAFILIAAGFSVVEAVVTDRMVDGLCSNEAEGGGR